MIGRRRSIGALLPVLVAGALAVAAGGCGASDPLDHSAAKNVGARTGSAGRFLPGLPPLAEPQPFAADSPWRRPIPPDPPVDRRSPVWVAELGRQVAAAGTYVNTGPYSVPVYTVSSHQPGVTVRLIDQNAFNAPLQRAFDHVPLPADAHPASGSDGSLTVWQPATDRIWDFWQLRRSRGGWVAQWGGLASHVSRGQGYFDQPGSWGGTASGIPLLAGMIRISDLEAGRIDHPLSLAIPHTAARRWVLPARRTDGDDPRPSAVPEGLRLQLDPALDVNSLHLTPFARMVALAAQRYGLIVRDRAGTVALSAEDPAPTRADPYPRLFGGVAEYELLNGFPWNRLRALRAPEQVAP